MTTVADRLDFVTFCAALVEAGHPRTMIRHPERWQASHLWVVSVDAAVPLTDVWRARCLSAASVDAPQVCLACFGDIDPDDTVLRIALPAEIDKVMCETTRPFDPDCGRTRRP